MSTSCGSPCYAAPELVVSEGLYVGSAVDIWSCGVILYAMLSGYLPYDDDPSNPDGDNINLLYKYIMSTRLNFPEHMSYEAKHLLQMMLVPNPEYRCRIEQIMDHPWLALHRDIFDKSVPDHEMVFQDNMYRKSQAAKRELGERRRVQHEAKLGRSMQRSQSSMPGATVTASMLDTTRRARETRHHSALPGATTMPEYLSNAGHRTPPLAVRQPLAPPAPLPAITQTSPIIAGNAIVISPTSLPTPTMPTALSAPEQEYSRPRADLMAPNLHSTPSYQNSSAAQSVRAVENEPLAAPSHVETPPADQERPTKPLMSANKNRHTIQVEYDENASYEQFRLAQAAASGTTLPEAIIDVSQVSDIEMESGESEQSHDTEEHLEASEVTVTPEASQVLSPPSSATIAPTDEVTDFADPTTPKKKGKHPDIAGVASPSTPRASKAGSADVTTPRGLPVEATPKASGQLHPDLNPVSVRSAATPSKAEMDVLPPLKPSGLPNIPPPRRERYRKGMSLDKFGLAKLLGQASSSTTDLPRTSAPSSAAAAVRIAETEKAQKANRNSMVRPRTADAASDKEKKSSRRRTLQLMVNRYVYRTSMNPELMTTGRRPGRTSILNPLQFLRLPLPLLRLPHAMPIPTRLKASSPHRCWWTVKRFNLSPMIVANPARPSSPLMPLLHNKPLTLPRTSVQTRPRRSWTGSETSLVQRIRSSTSRLPVSNLILLAPS